MVDAGGVRHTVMCVLLFCRLSEQSRLVAEQKRLVSELRGKCEDAQQWNFKYKVGMLRLMTGHPV